MHRILVNNKLQDCIVRIWSIFLNIVSDLNSTWKMNILGIASNLEKLGIRIYSKIK